jgi:hypothetical protein
METEIQFSLTASGCEWPRYNGSFEVFERCTSRVRRCHSMFHNSTPHSGSTSRFTCRKSRSRRSRRSSGNSSFWGLAALPPARASKRYLPKISESVAVAAATAKATRRATARSRLLEQGYQSKKPDTVAVAKGNSGIPRPIIMPVVASIAARRCAHRATSTAVTAETGLTLPSIRVIAA